MYNTSAEYKSEIAQRTVSYIWYGTITLTSGYVIRFGLDVYGAPIESNLDQSKSKLTRQFTTGETLEIGNAFSSELILGLRDTDSLQVSDHHYEFYGAVINLTFRLYGDSLANTETTSGRKYEDVPCGLFTVEDAEFTYHTCVLTAYDNLHKAATTKITSKLSDSKAFAALSALCTRMGITMATTRAEIEAMPNGTRTWAVSAFKKGTFCKDIIEELCTVLGANAICNRSGQLVIKPYSTTSVREIGDSNRYSSSYVDYLGRYTKLALENADGDEEVYSCTTTYNTGKPLTLSIGKVKILNKKETSTRGTAAKAIIDQLATIMYAPLDIAIPTDPSIDIGDTLTGSGSNFDDPFLFIDTKDEASLFGQQKITSAGGNYELANRKKATKAEKAVSDLEQQQVEIGNNMAIIQTQMSELSGMINIGYILPIAIDTDDIEDGHSRDVLTFNFKTEAIEPEEESEEEGDANEAISFYAQLCFYVDTTTTNGYCDGLVTVTYTMDGVDTASSVYAYRDGWKILTLNGFFPSLEAGDHVFVVSISCSGGAIKTPN